MTIPTKEQQERSMVIWERSTQIRQICKLIEEASEYLTEVSVGTSIEGELLETADLINMCYQVAEGLKRDADPEYLTKISEIITYQQIKTIQWMDEEGI